jgi:hypothetical protein
MTDCPNDATAERSSLLDSVPLDERTAVLGTTAAGSRW